MYSFIYEDLGSDDLILCPRCGDRDALIGQICNGCKTELNEHHEYQIGWREAWEREKAENLRWKIESDPDYAPQQLNEFERLAREYADDPAISAAIAQDKENFELLLARIQEKKQ